MVFLIRGSRGLGVRPKNAFPKPGNDGTIATIVGAASFRGSGICMAERVRGVRQSGGSTGFPYDVGRFGPPVPTLAGTGASVAGDADRHGKSVGTDLGTDLFLR